MLGVGAAFAASSIEPRLLYLVPILLALNWFGDSLDGTVARVRDEQRPRYGYYVDHVVDIVGAVALFSGLALSGGMQPVIALALLVAYVAAMAEVFLATHVMRVFRLASFGFGPTELRIVLAVGAIALIGRPTVAVPLLGRVPLFDVGGVVAIVGIGAAFVTSAVRIARQLAREEQVRR
jgi:phosphatidylglycerophosphate synthase